MKKPKEQSSIERASRWNRVNKERRKEIQARYRAKNADKIAEQRKLLDPKKVAAYSRKWYAANKEKQAARNKAWRENNPVESRLLGHHRRVIIRATKVVKEEIVNWYTRDCGICGEILSDKFDIDHIIPISRGGLHETSNLQLTHPSCNRSKHNKLPSELTLQRTN